MVLAGQTSQFEIVRKAAEDFRFLRKRAAVLGDGIFGGAADGIGNDLTILEQGLLYRVGQAPVDGVDSIADTVRDAVIFHYGRFRGNKITRLCQSDGLFKIRHWR
jgi:hypothetical protein